MLGCLIQLLLPSPRHSTRFLHLIVLLSMVGLNHAWYNAFRLWPQTLSLISSSTNILHDRIAGTICNPAPSTLFNLASNAPLFPSFGQASARVAALADSTHSAVPPCSLGPLPKEPCHRSQCSATTLNNYDQQILTRSPFSLRVLSQKQTCRMHVCETYVEAESSTRTLQIHIFEIQSCLFQACVVGACPPWDPGHASFFFKSYLRSLKLYRLLFQASRKQRSLKRKSWQYRSSHSSGRTSRKPGS